MGGDVIRVLVGADQSHGSVCAISRVMHGRLNLWCHSVAVTAFGPRLTSRAATNTSSAASGSVPISHASHSGNTAAGTLQ